MTAPESESRPRTFFRVDPRLVHATMLNTWVPVTGARRLIVADRNLMKDPRRRTIFEMSAMGAVEVEFCEPTEVAGVLGRLDESAGTIIAVFSTLEGVLEALDTGLRLDRLNVGHLPQRPGTRTLHPAVHITAGEMEAITQLQTRGVEVVSQPLPHDKIRMLGRPEAADLDPRVKDAESASGEVEGTLRVVNAKGLHLRAAHHLAHLISKLPCEVQIALDGTCVNAKSLLGLTTLGATCGCLLRVKVHGPGANEAYDQIKRLFESGFDEGVDWRGDSEASA